MVSFSDSYADEDKSGIRVAQYLTELPSKEVLLRQLQKIFSLCQRFIHRAMSGRGAEKQH